MNIKKKILVISSGFLSVASYAMTTPLHNAAQSLDGVQTQQLINQAKTEGKLPAVLEARDAFDRTPLHIAAACGHTTAVRLLLQTGANPNAIDKNGSTPLHEVVYNQRTDVLNILEIIQELVAAHADVNVRDKQDWTPLYLAATRFDAILINALRRVGVFSLDAGSAVAAALDVHAIKLMHNLDAGPYLYAALIIKTLKAAGAADKRGNSDEPILERVPTDAPALSAYGRLQWLGKCPY